jgi:hypothetical protein
VNVTISEPTSRLAAYGLRPHDRTQVFILCSLDKHVVSGVVRGSKIRTHTSFENRKRNQNTIFFDS